MSDRVQEHELDRYNFISRLDNRQDSRSLPCSRYPLTPALPNFSKASLSFRVSAFAKERKEEKEDYIGEQERERERESDNGDASSHDRVTNRASTVNQSCFAGGSLAWRSSSAIVSAFCRFGGSLLSAKCARNDARATSLHVQQRSRSPVEYYSKREKYFCSFGHATRRRCTPSTRKFEPLESRVIAAPEQTNTRRDVVEITLGKTPNTARRIFPLCIARRTPEISRKASVKR